MASWMSSVSVWPLGCKNKIVRGAVPIQLVALGMRRDPDLVNRRIGADDKLAGRFFELDGERPAVEIHLEVRVVGSRGQPAIQRFQRLVGAVLEFLIVHDLASPRKPG